MGNSTDNQERNKDQVGQNKGTPGQQNQQGQTGRQDQQGRTDQKSGQQGGSQQGNNDDRMNRKDDSK